MPTEKREAALIVAQTFDDKPDQVETMPSAALYAALELHGYAYFDGEWRQTNLVSFPYKDVYVAERHLLLWFVMGIPCPGSMYGTAIAGRKLLPNPKT